VFSIKEYIKKVVQKEVDQYMETLTKGPDFKESLKDFILKENKSDNKLTVYEAMRIYNSSITHTEFEIRYLDEHKHERNFKFKIDSLNALPGALQIPAIKYLQSDVTALVGIRFLVWYGYKGNRELVSEVFMGSVFDKNIYKPNALQGVFDTLLTWCNKNPELFL